MTGYMQVNLTNMIKEIGEDRTKSIISDFSCKSVVIQANLFYMEFYPLSPNGVNQEADALLFAYAFQ